MSSSSDRVSLNQLRWSNIVVFFSSFLLALGCLLFSTVHGMHHKLHCFSLMMIAVGLVGVITGFSRKLWMVHVLMALLLLLTVGTLRVVYGRLMEKKADCLDSASQLQVERSTLFLEAMPGVYFEVGSKVHFFVAVDPEALRACEQHVSSMWVHSVFLLLTLLACSLVCSWRFIRAITADREGEVSIAYTEVDADGRVTHSVCTSPDMELFLSREMAPDSGLFPKGTQ
eukprot:TRINITY_DN7165_c0_g3_i1.p1 TRINITY_DN7165_c0_g3~~TRINITY_DN7165_c0_g3_i1.p1  ORF type:complete len:228 (+),score=50.99 TRINITY_DN7165_c0_g3_i1:115-798(+)